ncbi:class II aldolase/adducin family protein [Sphingobium sp. BYY-5]|uniref:class II aldolase/adducin family protein n=1 Tax=Sphingobium sp. BYY-5 TaxID=2926400 RepID=UPI001FA7778C|nr:class II aldolase/adducin family protein [Sphingobium sp. BYY-5]MCI4591781.1 class II aldolase/adducin family protein [Sphingobium sp. BYY-5]
MPTRSISSPSYASARFPVPRIHGVPRDGDGPLAAVPKSHLSIIDERLHRKQQLAASLRLLARHGVEPGLAGHLSARDPENPDHFWVNPVGVPFSHICVSDLLRIDGNGRVVEGDGPVNVSGIAYHHGVQRARPEVVGIVHAHSFHAKTWSAFGRPVEPIVADLAVFHDDQVLFTPDRPPQKSEAEAREEVAGQFVHALGDRNILLWRNHGHWTVGNSVESAAWRFIAYESAARVQLAALAAGTPIIDPPARPPSAEQREAWAWLSFLPYWDEVIRDEPDLFD